VLTPGATLGDRYVLEEPVARGGMGEVWRGTDPVLGRTVAVKVLLPDLSNDPDFAERFRHEARAMAVLSDPGIVEVYDYGSTNGVAYLVMPFLEGESLHHLLSRVGPLPSREAMGIVAQAARALQQAHQYGIVHRDVKPGNLLVRPDGRVVLTDFGIARMVAGWSSATSGQLIGTAAYLAPEQISGALLVAATDIYALGVVAYECLTLHPPFSGDTPLRVAMMHVRDEPPPLPESVPPPVRNVVMRALAKDPHERWATAAAMAEAAAEAVRGLPPEPWSAVAPVPAPPPRSARPMVPTALLPPEPPRPRRGRVWAGLLPILAGLVLIVAATAIVLSRMDSPANPPAPPATPVQSGVNPDDTPQQTDQNNDGGDKHGGDNGGRGDGTGGHGHG
jgi:serine/threonine-protein kinase